MKKLNDNIICIKLIFFQSFFTFINFNKNVSLNDDDLDWFYKFYQNSFYNACDLLNIKHSKSIYKKKHFKINKEMFLFYNEIYDFIINNKHKYINVNI